MFLLTLLVFLLILGLLIFVHEAGHFTVAKLSDVKVDEFAFGFPPRLICRKRGETKYCINAFPVGGYVKMLGEDEDDNSPRSFSKKKARFRLAIVVAGVVMNFLLGGILLSIGYGIGMTPISIPESEFKTNKVNEVIIAHVNPGSPAEQNGLKVGDTIVGFNSIEDFSKFSRENLGKQVSFQIKRSGDTQERTLVVSENKEAPIGIGLASLSVVKLPFFGSIYYGFKDMVLTSKNVVIALYSIVAGLFQTGKVSEAISGPVGIFNITGQAVQLGFIYIIQLAALLSINLAIINILPFPGLDGSRALIIFLEGIFRKKVIKSEIESVLHMVGFVLLIALIVLVTIRDIL
jgi:regulator of sigma E protease